MKILIIAVVIASIVGDHWTIQATPVNQCSPDQQVELFKKYALKLAIAAVPLFRTSEPIMEGGCECLPGMDVNEKADYLDLTLATMSIVRDHSDDLEHIRKSSDFSKIITNRGLMENIRLILVVLQSSPDVFKRVPGSQPYEKYVFRNNKRSPSDSGSGSGFDRSVESAVNCYRSLLSINYKDNNRYFSKIVTGAKIANVLMHHDDKDSANAPIEEETRANLAALFDEIFGANIADTLHDDDDDDSVNETIIMALRAHFDKIVDEISHGKLETPGADFEKETLENLRKFLTSRNSK